MQSQIFFLRVKIPCAGGKSGNLKYFGPLDTPLMPPAAVLALITLYLSLSKIQASQTGDLGKSLFVAHMLPGSHQAFPSLKWLQTPPSLPSFHPPSMALLPPIKI